MKIGITRKRRGLDLVTLLLVLLLAIPHLCSAWILNYSRSAAHVSRGLSAFDALESVGRRPTSCFVLPQHSLMSDSDSEPRTMPSGDDNKNNASSSSANLPLRKRQRRPLLRHIPPIASQQKLEQSQTAAEMRQREAEKDPTLLTPFTFQSCSGSITSQDNTTTSTTLSLSPSLARALTEKLKLQRWTSIQAQTWPHAIAGRSILGKARTGTGKTLAYLLPTVQRILNSQKLEVQVRPGRDVGIVIIAPTRELAQQISREAESLLNFQHGWTVQSVTGGTSLSRDKARLWHQQCAPTILVATPGRLLDLLQSDSKTVGLSDTGDRRNRQLANLLRNTPIVILDEADLLLQGFQKEMTKILSYFPRVEKRQTMLFSATTPAKLLGLLSSTAGSHIISKEYVFVDCVGVGDDAKLLQTNRRVDHCYIQLDCMEHYLAGLLSILRDAVLGDSLGKIIVFFPTAKLVTFAAELLKSFFVPNDSSIRERRVQILSIHSRMSHGARQRASSLFRVSDDRHTSILLTSDVSARGVDYGDVNLVIQYGAPSTEELYLHRLGRTGRAGQEGRGLLVILPFETRFKVKLTKGKVHMESSKDAILNNPSSDVLAKATEIKQLVRNKHSVLTPLAENAYQSFISHYREYGCNGVSSDDVDSAAKSLSKSFGLFEYATVA